MTFPSPFINTSQLNNSTSNQYTMNNYNDNTHSDFGDSDKPSFKSKEHEQWINERHSRERPSRTLFVRNIDFHCTDRDLEEHFKQYGPLRDFFSMSSRRGIAFITFRAKEGLNGSIVCGRHIDVHYSLPREDLTIDTKCDHTKNQGTLFLVFEDQNVAQRISDDDLRMDLESKFGEIVSMDLLRGNPAQRFVEFYDSRACVKAQRGLDRTDFRGSNLIAEFSWDKATKEAIQPGQSNRDRFIRTRRSRSRSPGSRYRKDDRFSKHNRSPARRYNIDDRFNGRPNPYSYTAPSLAHPPAASGMSAEQVQRMLLAAAGSSTAQPPNASYSNTSNALNHLAASFSTSAPTFGSNVQQQQPISAKNAAMMMNQAANMSTSTNNALSSQLAALSALLPSLTSQQQSNVPQQQQPQQQIPSPNPTWAALAQLMNAANQNINTSSQNVSSQSSAATPLAAQLSSLLGSVSQSTNSHVGNNGTVASTAPQSTGYNAYAALLQQMRSQQGGEGSSSSGSGVPKQ